MTKPNSTAQLLNRVCEDCGHPWSSHTTGGMCMGDQPEGSECYCVMILPADERAVIEEFDPGDWLGLPENYTDYDWPCA